MALLDLLGRRWVMRIIWELRADELNFRQLQERCGGMSSSVLAARLRDLRDAGVAELADDGYGLTAEGRVLLEAFAPLQEWAGRWERRARSTT
jgi:DNA-binding HxlR family transcriptional regulator